MLQLQTDIQGTRPITHAARFVLRYNYSKAKTTSQSKHIWRTAEGVRFGSGRIAIDLENGNGDGYGSVREMQTALAKQGAYEIQWVD